MSICDEFMDTTLRNECEHIMTRALAIKGEDPTLCKKLGIEEGDCIQEVIVSKALKMRDPRVCSELFGEIIGAGADTLSNRKDRCVMHVINIVGKEYRTIEQCELITTP